MSGVEIMSTTFRKRKTQDCTGSAFSINGGPEMKEGLAGAVMVEERLSEMNTKSRYTHHKHATTKKITWLNVLRLRF